MEFIGRIVRRFVETIALYADGLLVYSRVYPKRARVAIIAFVCIVIFSTLAWNAPRNFPERALITIENGETLSEVADTLSNEHIIESKFIFKSWVAIIGGARQVQAGDYFFDSPEGPLTVAQRVSGGDYRLSTVRVVIPEGTTLKDMATIFSKALNRFDIDEFLKITEGKEGYLFPDTYFFLPNVSAKQIADTMEQEFNDRIMTISSDITSFGKPLSEIITMASILEEEARQYDTQRIISGILWKRIEIGMPLQVDAVFPYIIGKNTFEITSEDLNIDSPYNTYKYPGLPPGPITNPGIDAIRAAVKPIKTDYLFYLSDSDGEMHYAKDFETHKANKIRYLQ